MPELTDAAAIAIAKSYLDHPQRFTSAQEERARKIVTETAVILSTISRHVSQNSTQRANAEFEFRLDGQPGTAMPASMAKKRGEPTYGARISLAFVEGLFNRIADLDRLCSREYKPEVLVVFASVTAIAHEFSHGIYGHREDDNDDERELCFQELDADRRAGAGSLVLFSDTTVRKMTSDWFGVRSELEFLEAAMFAQSLLACALSGADRTRYAPSKLRSFLYFDGLRSSVMLTGFSNFLEIEVARKNAERLARSVEEKLRGGSELVQIRKAHDACERLMRKGLREEIYKVADRTITESRFRDGFSVNTTVGPDKET